MFRAWIWYQNTFRNIIPNNERIEEQEGIRNVISYYVYNRRKDHMLNICTLMYMLCQRILLISETSFLLKLNKAFY